MNRGSMMLPTTMPGGAPEKPDRDDGRALLQHLRPVVPEDHYCIPPLQRLDLDEVLRLVRQRRYFVLHAPRQTGKTSALLALRDLLNEGGEHRCVYANVETAQTARGDVAAGMRTIRRYPNARSSPWTTASWTKRGSGRWRAPVLTAPCAKRLAGGP